MRTTYSYKTVAGHEILADVHLPDGDGPRPVVLWVHGGALIAGHRGGILPKHREGYLAAGYAVVCSDYRLAPETKLPQIVEDVQDAFAWVRAAGPRLFGADPDRVAAVGHSGGGYLALTAGVVVQPRLRAIVSFYGYGDIIGDWYRLPDPCYRRQPLVTEAEARAVVGSAPVCSQAEWEDRRRFYLYCRQQGLWPKEVAGFDPETEREAFLPFCPVQNVTPDYPPTLLLHGDQDTDVPYEQSVLMAQALSRAGVPHELITLPGGPHGFDEGDTPAANAAFERVLRFLRQRL
jgi:acetyl esterase/lipase